MSNSLRPNSGMYVHDRHQPYGEEPPTTICKNENEGRDGNITADLRNVIHLYTSFEDLSLPSPIALAPFHNHRPFTPLILSLKPPLTMVFFIMS
jgi:hypothetical protein